LDGQPQLVDYGQTQNRGKEPGKRKEEEVVPTRSHWNMAVMQQNRVVSEQREMDYVIQTVSSPQTFGSSQFNFGIDKHTE
jgi:hypothetical protein